MNPEEYGRMHELETHYWWFVGRRAIIAEQLQHALKTRSSATPLALLDIGCGTGANLAMLAEMAGARGHIAALDYSPLAISFAARQLTNGRLNGLSMNRQVAGGQVPTGQVPEVQVTDGQVTGGQGAAPSIALLRGDATRLPFASGRFDVVTMLDVLEHVEDDAAAVREIYRVLKPGGIFVLSVPAYQRLWSAHDEALHHFRRYEYAGLRGVLAGGGFQVSRLSFAMSAMPPIAWFWRRFILPFGPRRNPEAKRHSEGAVLPTVPEFANRALIKYLQGEGKLLRWRPLKFGTSLVAVARKGGGR